MNFEILSEALIGVRHVALFYYCLWVYTFDSILFVNKPFYVPETKLRNRVVVEEFSTVNAVSKKRL